VFFNQPFAVEAEVPVQTKIASGALRVDIQGVKVESAVMVVTQMHLLIWRRVPFEEEDERFVGRFNSGIRVPIADDGTLVHHTLTVCPIFGWSDPLTM
jgi:hypothetical protein